MFLRFFLFFVPVFVTLPFCFVLALVLYLVPVLVLVVTLNLKPVRVQVLTNAYLELLGDLRERSLFMRGGEGGGWVKI